MDILKDRCYKDRNEIVAYINDIQYNQNEILEQLGNHRRTNDHLRNLEAWVKHIDFHMHEHVGYFSYPLVMPPKPPHLYVAITSSYLFVFSWYVKATKPLGTNRCQIFVMVSSRPQS